MGNLFKIDCSIEEDLFVFALFFVGFFKISLNTPSSTVFDLDKELGSGILSESGGKINGFFFFTKNSSFDKIFSFLSIFPTLEPPQETKKKETNNMNILIFFKKPFHNKKHYT